MDNDRKQLIDEILNGLQTFRRKIATESQHFSKGSITPAQATVLFSVKHQDNITIRGLATKLGISKSAVTKLVDELVSKQILSRAVDQTDRRSVCITLSAEGKKHIRKMKSDMEARFVHFFERLDTADLNNLKTIFNKMTQSNTDL